MGRILTVTLTLYFVLTKQAEFTFEAFAQHTQ